METNYTYKPLKTISKWSITLIVLCLLFSVAAVIGSLVEWSTYSQYSGNDQMEDLTPSDLTTISAITVGIHLPKTFFFIVSLIVFLVWIYRAHANGRALQLDGTIYTPGWSAAFYLIPIVNIVLPLLSLLHLHKGGVKRANSVQKEQIQSKVWMIYTWWVLYWSSYLLSIPNGISETDAVLSDIQGEIPSLIFSEILYFAAGIFLIFVIKNVTAVQERAAS
ncbi:protein of unknown function [Alteribacillus persepolensis]|uniref:DUF4328 domain-containing protein n=1 Tax=Alteribacillus persepolensis TaxID=568899 RepID=A0A1G8GL68_9BACI|nr:DUF4328 domain-containing protein [Alteribacillus persepolensis]SDH95076.1 protein of unknown function [Alteribacillus persepolensis]